MKRLLLTFYGSKPRYLQQAQVLQLIRKPWLPVLLNSKQQLRLMKPSGPLTKRHLEIFDELDLEAFNDRDMERIGEIHADKRSGP